MPQVWLHAGAVPGADLWPLQRLLDDIGVEHGVRYRLGKGRSCRAALLDLDTATHAPPAVVRQHTAALAAVLYERAAAHDFQTWQQQRPELARQLSCLLPRRGPESPRVPAAVPTGDDGTGAPSSVLSSLFDDAADREPDAAARVGLSPTATERELVARVLAGLDDLAAPALHAGFGPQAALQVDFAGWRVRLDPDALRGLRVRRALPRLDASARPAEGALEIDLDQFVWDLGQACGDHVWLDQPAQPWDCPLTDLALERVERYTRRSRHLELARRLQQGPATPEDLRRHVRIGVPELRRFVQACLFLGLLKWADGRARGGLDDR